MKRLERKDGERGSVTIEASISMICFTFLMISILLFINVGRAQMAIQTAINKSAQEISQYMYLYKVSGLYDLDVSIQASGEDASEKMSSAMTSLDSIVAGYEVVVGDIANGGAVEGEISASNLDGYVAQVKTIVSDGQAATENLKTQSGEIKKIIGEVKDNPTAFLKSLAALGVSKVMDEAKSFLVGSILGAALTEKYLDESHVDADTRLRTMNVVDGLDGLDFSHSSIFSRTAGSAGKERDINLVVVYKVRVFTLFSKEFSIPFAQSASVQAWLGGDAEISVLKQAVNALESKAESEESSEESESDTSTDESKPEESTEESSAEESTEESTEESAEGIDNIWNSDEAQDFISNREEADALAMGMYDVRPAYADFYDPEMNEFITVLPLDMTMAKFDDDGTELATIINMYMQYMKSNITDEMTLIDGKGNEQTVLVDDTTRFCLRIVVPEGSSPEYIEQLQNLLIISYGLNYSFDIVEGYGSK